MTRFYASAAAVALAALLGWQGYQMVAHRSADAFAACRSGAVAGGQIGGPFSLVDGAGKTVTDATLLTKPALIYFGYTSCADVCPLDNARNAAAAGLLAKQGLDVTPVFISVDPTRDTPQVMADYASNFDKLVALTGTEGQVDAVAKAYKVYFQVPQKRDPGYAVDHTTMTYLMLPKTGFADFFQRDAKAEEIAARTACFLKASQASLVP
jgi:protein SCO1/2